ncbi:hypothetical protein MNBD_PLANCTO03-838 [hydrothermal vent metagenome]|uniref:Uncharacterized protein n=1 Tax=hydrothermal vent metagenome TaxID=652676 RepID=A0A3B1CYU7_9ZZZZ
MTFVMRRKAFDDRGEPYTPVVLAEMVRFAESDEDRVAARALQKMLRRVVKEETRRWSFERFLISIGLSIAFLAIITATLFLFGNMLGGIPSLLVVIFVIVAVTLADRWIAKRRIGRAIGATIVAHGICGRCGYSLRGLGITDNGCLVCPECASVWRAGRLTRAHWEPPKQPLAPKPTLAMAMRIRLLRPRMMTDSRSMLCRRLDSFLVSVGRQRRAELGAERCRQLRAAIRRPTLWLRLTIGVLLAAALLWLFLHWPDADTTMDGALMRFRVLWSCGVVILLLMLAGTLGGELGITARRVAAVCTEENLCASCATDLLDPDAEGYRICPSCGSSWTNPPA